MKAHFRVLGGRITLELEGGTQKELFAAIADAQDVFDADTVCGLCNGQDLRFQVRHIEGNAFYELACRGCTARLTFGQHKEGGTLYPKRGEGNRGWAKFQRPTETPSPRAAAGAAAPQLPRQLPRYPFPPDR